MTWHNDPVNPRPGSGLGRIVVWAGLCPTYGFCPLGDAAPLSLCPCTYNVQLVKSNHGHDTQSNLLTVLHAEQCHMVGSSTEDIGNGCVV